MSESHMLTMLIAGAATAALITPLVIRAAHYMGVLDRPSTRSADQRTNIPVLGGLAVAGGFAVALFTGIQLMPDWKSHPGFSGLIPGVVLILIVGIYDDCRDMNASVKGGLTALAALLPMSMGLRIEYVTDPVSMTSYWLPSWLSWFVTLVWIVGITNAMNLVDGLDGLATGVGIIIGATLSVLAWQANQMVGVCIGVALVAGLLGFLPFNFPPARIFLGDTGALLTGYTLSVVALEGYRQATLFTFVVPLLALGVPILDTMLSIFRRIRSGAPVFVGDRLHMHHRLLAVEGTHRGAVLQFYILTSAFCLIALSFTKLQGFVAGFFLAAVGMLTLRLLRNLGAFEIPESSEEISSGGGEK
ncbi:undecaprenyl/decaprenyl-phosphate alpha-N-acetylglucosaminyl 1-phosphate transferase [Myxococcota bacterium]|nr:undecaprenyl/decaprenyl-phosphate alpha-N-acetylglucosaminyl 1-phosphate transferase [Myxococcota bacterium]